MGDGIDPQLVNGVISSLLALLILWLKSSLDNKASEIKERISVIDANVSHIDNTINIYNQQTQMMAQQTQTRINMHQVQEPPRFIRIEDRIKGNEKGIEVTEE
jgi:hypothetical protein